MFNPSTPISVGQAFGIPAYDQCVLMGGAEGQANVPPKQEYVFEKTRLADLIVFWQSKSKALKVVGDPAAGKTSLIAQWHARMNWPMYFVSCNAQTTSDELIGSFVPQADGTFKFVYGAVARAAMEGVSVLLDEGNALEPNAVLSLHLLLEGYPLYIPQTGETITPKPGFRVFQTENVLSSKMAIAGRFAHDASSEDRYMEIKVDYLAAEQEKLILIETLKEAGMGVAEADGAADALLKMATYTRKAYHKRESKVIKPMSTRVLKRWAALSWSYRGVSRTGLNPILYALERAFSGVPPEMMDELKEQYKTLVGV